jgi:diguanylate cyclase (GGDEF)-like protein
MRASGSAQSRRRRLIVSDVPARPHSTQVDAIRSPAAHDAARGGSLDLVTYRVLIVDDHPDLRAVLRMRLEFEPDIDVVGEASNGVEAVRLTALLSPSAVVIDFEMPVMTGPEAIPQLRAIAPGMGIVLYTAAQDYTLAEDATPDAVVEKGVPLDTVVAALRRVLEHEPFDVVRLELGSVPLQQAITAFDTWTGLNMRVMAAIHRDAELSASQLCGSTRDELEALMGIYAHIGFSLQRAARSGTGNVALILHVMRENGVRARRALLAFSEHRVTEFWRAWGYEVPAAALEALSVVREQLMEVLPASTGSDQPADASAQRKRDRHAGLGGSDGAAAERSRQADHRDRSAIERDRVRDDRDDVLAQRDLSGEARDGAGDVRDHAGGARDDAGAKRDDAAERRDRAAEDLEADAGSPLPEASRLAAVARHAAAGDRREALEDRRASASERDEAERDRGAALSDRLAGARHRTAAETDRAMSSTDRDDAQLDRVAAAEERDSASVDSLTGVTRRGEGFLALDREIARTRRAGESLVVGFIDVDGLKAVNDRHGHAAGDQMLRDIARTLRASLRDADLVFRYGGDEFVCALSAADTDFAYSRLARVNGDLGRYLMPASVTSGFAQLRERDSSADVLARADAALYQNRRERLTR